MIPENIDFTNKQNIMKQLIENGVQGMTSIFETLFNEAMKIERAHALNANHYERSGDRKGYANGYKDKTYHSRCGSLRIKIPQVRGMSFYPKSLEKGDRSERSLKLAMAEMYVQGVSTRKVSAIVEELCGIEVSSTQVSDCAKLLDEELKAFRSRPLNGAYTYVYFDATYEKIRVDKSVISMATLIAIGVNEDGAREVLGISSKLSEAEVHWKDFFRDLQQRGLSGVQLIISDAHEGMKAARRAVFPSIKWQRCQFHMAQNAQSYAPKKTVREELGEAVRQIFHSSDYETAQLIKERVIEKYKEKAPQFVEWLEENVEEGLTCFSFPEKHRKKIRTSNVIERINREVKRRTKVVTLFPNVASCERLVSALLKDVHEDWMSAYRYLDMSYLEK